MPVDLDKDLDDDPNEEDVLEGQIFDPADEASPGTEMDVLDEVAEPLPYGARKHVGYIGAGLSVLIHRLWDARTLARYERMLRAAEAVGDHETALEWEARAADFRRDRHQRRMDWIELPARALGIAPKAALIFVSALLTIGALLAIAARDFRKVISPFLVLADVVAFLVVATSLLWFPVLVSIPFLALAVLWAVGRHHEEGSGASWLRTAAEEDLDIQIDETTIARALEALRIPQINAHFKEGLPLQYLTQARRDGRGTHAVVRLPAGVTAERIARRRADLASGLYRLAKEVWPTTGSEAGILDLWVADKGALNEGAGPYPLLDDGFTDVFKGVPFGRTLRGDPVTAPLIGRNTLVGGMPEQGKSSAARAVMAGAALDPTAELRIWVPDANYDFEVFRRRCSRYVMGAEDDRIEQILQDLRELYEELQSRGEMLVQCQEPEVTRALADKVPGLHPVFCLLEEAHVAMNHRVHGEEISWLIVEIVKLDRKRGIHFIVSTQAPTSTSIPRDVTRNCSNGLAFAVGDHVANDALLGQGAYAAGHRATELIPGTDRGTALAKGFSGERSQLVQVHFLSVSRGNDQVTPLLDRVLAEIKRRGRAVPGTNRPRPELEARDLLEDLDQALGHERVRLSDVSALLRDLAPHWPPYRALNGQTLKKQLDAEGVRTTNSGNVLRLDPADLRSVIAERSTEDLDTWV